MNAEVRLDPTDAVVVDTLITDGEVLQSVYHTFWSFKENRCILQSLLSLGFGSPQAMGHLNFYVNGGVAQPGCGSLYSSLKSF